MKQFIVVSLLVVALVCGLMGASRTVRADDIITDAQINLIKTNCVDLKARLSRLHDNDLLLRTDRGSLYRTISEKLMVPLNQRAAANQVDASALVKTSADYNDAYTEFYNAYTDYDASLSSALTIDCKNAPTTFYNQLQDARAKRETLHSASQVLVQLAQQYGKQVKQLKSVSESEGNKL